MKSIKRKIIHDLDNIAGMAQEMLQVQGLPQTSRLDDHLRGPGQRYLLQRYIELLACRLQ